MTFFEKAYPLSFFLYTHKKKRKKRYNEKTNIFLINLLL